MVRQIAVLFATFAILASAAPGEAQQAEKLYRIGHLGSGSRGMNESLETFRQRLRELGYVEGKNIIIKWSFSKGKGDRIHERVADLLSLDLDCIFTTGVRAARAAKKATGKIPIVMLLVSNPVKRGLVASVARPEGNITGLTTGSSGIVGKRLELLKATLPQATRFALLRDNSRATGAVLREAKAAALTIGVELQSLEVQPPFDFETAFKAAVEGRAEGLLVSGQGFRAASLVDRIVNLAAKSRLPAIYGAPRFARAGGFMHYGPDRRDHFRRGAEYVDKILKGAKPADLPVEYPRKFNLVVNLKTARALGIAVPPSILLRATEVIE